VLNEPLVAMPVKALLTVGTAPKCLTLPSGQWPEPLSLLVSARLADSSGMANSDAIRQQCTWLWELHCACKPGQGAFLPCSSKPLCTVATRLQCVWLVPSAGQCAKVV
jgi:hypothetical protein